MVDVVETGGTLADIMMVVTVKGLNLCSKTVSWADVLFAYSYIATMVSKSFEMRVFRTYRCVYF